MNVWMDGWIMMDEGEMVSASYGGGVLDQHWLTSSFLG